jgi:uncharacterized membrane protein
MTFFSYFWQRAFKVVINPLNFLLGISVLFSFALLVLRYKVTGEIHFTFLIWNLFLAGLPLLASTAVRFLDVTSKLRWYNFIPILGFWLLFLPNAPYILTDLFHLRPRPSTPLWLDLMVILSFAWNGLIMGFVSLLDMHDVVNKYAHKFWGWALALSALVASSFGIYLGRFLRWNSWDIINHPQELLRELAHMLCHPFSHPTMLGITFCFSGFLVLAYAFIVQLRGRIQ